MFSPFQLLFQLYLNRAPQLRIKMISYFHELPGLYNQPEPLNSADEDIGRVGDMGGENRQPREARLPLPQWLTSLMKPAGTAEFGRRGIWAGLEIRAVRIVSRGVWVELEEWVVRLVSRENQIPG
jgi:hypothetical protein